MTEKTPAELRRIHAVSAINQVLNSRRQWLDPVIVREVADAALEAAHPYAEHCVHYVAVHHQHHDLPVTGCPWCTRGKGPQDIKPQGDLL
jgi:hypothetical protein